MHLTDVQTALGLIISAGIIAGGLVRGAHALVRAARAGQHLTDSMDQNTEAINRLSDGMGDITNWRHETDRRIDRLELGHP